MTNQISQLESNIELAQTAQQKIDAINALAWELRDTDIEKAVSLSQEADHLSTTGDFFETPYQKGVADSLRNMGIMNQRSGNYYEALSNSLKALSIYQLLEDTRGQIEAYTVLGAVYDHLGNYSEALFYGQKGLALSEEIQDHSGIANINKNIGVIYNKIGEYDKELEMYQKSLALYKQTDDSRGEALTLNNMAMAYYALKKYPEALKVSTQSLALAKKLKLTIFEANVLCTIGEIHLEQNQLSKAEEYFQESLAQAKEIGFPFIELHSILNIAKSHQKKQLFPEALDFFIQALEIAEDIDEKQTIIECYQALSEISKLKKNYEISLAYFEKYHLLEKEIFNEKTSAELKNLDIHYQASAQEREIAREAQFRTLFEDSPISIWEADCTKIKEYFDQLTDSGVSDLETYFEDRSDEVLKCLRLMKISNVNEKGIKLYQAPNKATFLAKFKPYIYPDAYDALKTILMNLANGKLQQHASFPSITFQEKKLFTENFITVARGYEDTWEKVIVSSIDISEGERTKQVLEESELRFRVLFEDSPIAIFEQDGSEIKKHIDQLIESGITDIRKYFIENPDQVYFCYSLLKITDINQAGLDLYETEDKDFLIKDSKVYIDPETVDAMGGILADFVEGDIRSTGRFISFTMKGKKILLETSTVLLPEHKDTWVKLVATAIDITEQERIKQELSDNEAQFRTLFDDSPIAIYEQDASKAKRHLNTLREEGITGFRKYFKDNPDQVHYIYSLLRVTNVNQATVDLYEANSKDDYLNDDYVVTLYPDSVEAMGSLLVDFSEGKFNTTIQYPTLTAKGNKLVLETTVALSPAAEDTWSKVIATTIDVTAREKTKQLLQDSETQFRALYENSPIAIWEENGSAAKTHLDALRESGILDFKKYFKENPDEVSRVFSLITISNVNQATVNLFEAKSKANFLMDFSVYVDREAVEEMGEILADFADMKFPSKGQFISRTLTGKRIILETTTTLTKGDESSWLKMIATTVDVTEREKAKQILIDSEMQFRTLFENSPISIWETDASQIKTFFDSLKKSDRENLDAYFNKNPKKVKHCLSLLKITNANPKAIELFKAKDKEQLINGFGAYVPPDSFEAYKNFMLGLAEGQLNQELRVSGITFTGEILKIHNNFSISEEHSINLKKMIISTLDVTEREDIRQNLLASEELYRSVSDGANDGISIVDQGIFTYANPRLAVILGYEIDEIVGEHMSNFLHPDSFAEIQPLYVRAMGGEQMPPRVEGKAIKKNGTIINVDFNASALDNPPNPRLLIITRDITEQKQMEEQLRHLTITDSLTQISNRRHFFFMAVDEHHRALRYGRDLSIILFDLDQFKKVNDTYGHTAGDIVLQKTVEVCNNEIRETDLIARYGGEEFAILLPETSLKKAQDLADRLRKKVKKNIIKHDGEKIKITISAGVAQLDHSKKTKIEELIDQADKALYYSKQNGRNQVNTWASIKDQAL